MIRRHPQATAFAERSYTKAAGKGSKKQARLSLRNVY